MGNTTPQLLCAPVSARRTATPAARRSPLWSRINRPSTFNLQPSTWGNAPSRRESGRDPGQPAKARETNQTLCTHGLNLVRPHFNARTIPKTQNYQTDRIRCTTSAPWRSQKPRNAEQSHDSKKPNTTSAPTATEQVSSIRRFHRCPLSVLSLQSSRYDHQSPIHCFPHRVGESSCRRVGMHLRSGPGSKPKATIPQCEPYSDYTGRARSSMALLFLYKNCSGNHQHGRITVGNQ